MIRPARGSDLDEVASLDAAAFGTDAWSRGQVADELAAATRTVLVAETDGAVVAWASIVVAGDDADLTRIAVAADARRRGIARRLLDTAVAAAVGRGATRMLLEVADDNEPALGLYRAGGFEEIARRPRYYGSGADAVVMQRRLRDEEED